MVRLWVPTAASLFSNPLGVIRNFLPSAFIALGGKVNIRYQEQLNNLDERKRF